MSDRIIVSGLAVDSIVGTLPREREKPQRILVDLELLCDLAPAGKADDLALAPDYARAAERARDFCVQRKAQLLETLAEGVARLLLAEFKIDAATVRITKPGALLNASSASVEIHRRQMKPPHPNPPPAGGRA